MRASFFDHFPPVPVFAPLWNCSCCFPFFKKKKRKEKKRKERYSGYVKQEVCFPHFFLDSGTKCPLSHVQKASTIFFRTQVTVFAQPNLRTEPLERLTVRSSRSFWNRSTRRHITACRGGGRGWHRLVDVSQPHAANFWVKIFFGWVGLRAKRPPSCYKQSLTRSLGRHPASHTNQLLGSHLQHLWIPPLQETPPCVTFRLVVVSLRGPGRSPVLPFACCVGLLLSVGRCGRCSCWCCFRVRGAQWLVCWGCWCRFRVRGAQWSRSRSRSPPLTYQFLINKAWTGYMANGIWRQVNHSVDTEEPLAGLGCR